MYAKCGSIVDALKVFEKMPERDIFTWNTMVAGYAKHGCGRDALDVYDQMIQEGFTPDKVTFIRVLNACRSVSALQKGKAVHADIKKAVIAPDIILDTALVAMYAKCRSVKDASEVFNNMAHRNVVSWTVMIAGYAQHGFGRSSFETYERMIQEGVKPDKVTFICALNACGSLAALQKGKEIHADISKGRIGPDIFLDTALLTMYVKCGSLNDARQVFDNMPLRNVMSWSALIAGYAHHGNGREALATYEQMKRVGVMPNFVTFIGVLNACVSLVALGKGQHIHADIIRARIAQDVIRDTALVDMYAKCGSIKEG